ncbi:MAG: SDR family NAD(P)-dependent oxidoreductase [Alphaproteobacteria bacterium]|nr:SDR family NAD(P)-dependent oxidoreductase [Alphaproteobacteria bacterium]
MDLKGVAALVTGGASGLGRGTAECLIKAGAKVALLDLNKDQAEKTAKEIGALGLACDVASADSAAAAIAQAASAHGPARVLVNCAGIGVSARTVGRDGPHKLELFAKTIAVNLIGSFNMIRLAAAEMQKLPPLEHGERGVIVNTASVAAFDGQIGQAAYSASKGGIVGMTLPIARELAATGIRVLTIAPGIFSTPMLYQLPDEVKKSLAASVPFPQRLGEASEYGEMVLAICRIQMLNGEVIRLDGAIRMAPR